MWPTSGIELADAKRVAEHYREYWADVTSKGAQVRPFDRTLKSALEIVDLMCNNGATSQIPLKLQKELVTKRKRLDKTDAGRLVEGDVKKMLSWMAEVQKQDRNRLKILVKQEGPHRSNLESKIRRQEQTMDQWNFDRLSLRRALERVISVLSSVVFVFKRGHRFVGSSISLITLIVCVK